MTVTNTSTTATRPFSMFSTPARPPRPKLSLPVKAAPPPPAKSPPPKKAKQRPTETELIAARQAALAIARTRFPETFNDQYPALPPDIAVRLRQAVGNGGAAESALQWWVRQAHYRHARSARRRAAAVSAEACAEALATVQKLAPAVFDEADPKPLAIGIHEQIAALGLAPKDTDTLLQFWTSRPAYRTAVAKGGDRYNLDGTISGEVSDKHRHLAKLISAP